MLEVGKLYTCEEHCLLFYPDQETASAAPAAALPPAAFPGAAFPAAAFPGAAAAAAAAAFLSKRFGKPVSYTEKNIPLLVLQNKEIYIEVLVEDKKGWIIYEDWLNIKEIV